jgi:hypothetical protein
LEIGGDGGGGSPGIRTGNWACYYRGAVRVSAPLVSYFLYL